MPILTGLDEAGMVLSSMVTYAAASGCSIAEAMADRESGDEERRRFLEKLFDKSICTVLAAIAEREDIDPETRKAIEYCLASHSAHECIDRIPEKNPKHHSD